MSRCLHGMHGAFCALCNNRVMDRPDGHPVARPDLEPRFAKGRDSAKWIGIGTFMQRADHAGLRHAASDSVIGRFGPLRSEWSKNADCAAERHFHRPSGAISCDPQAYAESLRRLGSVTLGTKA